MTTQQSMSERRVVYVDIHKRENQNITVKNNDKGEEGQDDPARIDRRHVYI